MRRFVVGTTALCSVVIEVDDVTRQRARRELDRRGWTPAGKARG